MHVIAKEEVEEGGFENQRADIEMKLKKKKRKQNMGAVHMSRAHKELLFTRLVESEKRKEASVVIQCFRYLTTFGLL